MCTIASMATNLQTWTMSFIPQPLHFVRTIISQHRGKRHKHAENRAMLPLNQSTNTATASKYILDDVYVVFVIIYPHRRRRTLHAHAVCIVLRRQPPEVGFSVHAGWRYELGIQSEYRCNCVATTSSHDKSTFRGWRFL